MPKRLESSKNLRKLIDGFYNDVFTAEERGVPVAWLTVCVPLEVIRGMGILPFYPESYAAYCSARRITEDLIAIAEAKGYATDLCAYAKTTFGSMISGKGPFGPMPRPSVLISSNNQCGTVINWWRAVGRYYGVPCFFIDAPRVKREPTDSELRYIESQLHSMVGYLEAQTGRKLHESIFQEVMDLSNQALDLYVRILRLRRHRPAPYSAGDIFTHIFPIVTLGGTTLAVEHFQLLLDEIVSRVQRSEGITGHERFRLLWDNIPLWHRLDMFDYLAEKGVVVAADTYTSSWEYPPLDTKDPFKDMARRVTALYTNRGLDYRIKWISRLIEEYQVDGLLWHSNHSCKADSVGQMDLITALQQRYHLPALLFEGDMADLHYYSDDQTKKKFDAFIEMLESRVPA